MSTAVVRGAAPAPVRPAPARRGTSCDEPRTLPDTCGIALRLAAALTLVVTVIGLVVAAVCAGVARRWMAFPFPGVPATPGVAVGIFAHNLRGQVMVGGLLLVAQTPQWTSPAAEPGRVHRAVHLGGEAVVEAVIAANVFVVGVALGAYRGRMVLALLPHGPVEVVADALALALYLEGRHRRLGAGHALAVVALSTTLLALAAALETFVTL